MVLCKERDDEDVETEHLLIRAWGCGISSRGGVKARCSVEDGDHGVWGKSSGV